MVSEIEGVGGPKGLAGDGSERDAEHACDRYALVSGRDDRSVWVICVYLTSELLRYGLQTANVIGMAMGEEDSRQPDSVELPPYGINCILRIKAGTGIDQNGRTALHKICV
jgi:hypothetical protein